MERSNNVKGCVGSQTATQILRSSILPVVLFFLLMDMASSARPVQNLSGVHSSYRLEESIMDAAGETFDVGSNLGVVPVLQSDRPHDVLDTKSCLLLQRVPRRFLGCSPSSCNGVCVTSPPGKGPAPGCQGSVAPISQ